MDPILEEMRRAKSPSDIKESRYRDWVTYLCALVSRKDDEIATLKSQLSAFDRMRELRAVTIDAGDTEPMPIKRGPGRPRKDESHVG